MKRSIFLKTVCCMLVFALFSGCTPKSPLLAHADDTEVNYESSCLDLRNFSSAENAKGEEIRWFAKAKNPFFAPDPADRIFTLEGNMEHKMISKDESSVLLDVPFSKTFTVYSIYHHFPEEVSARNQSRKEDDIGGKCTSHSSLSLYSEGNHADQAGSFSTYQSVSGDWSKAVYHCNSVVELYGELEEVSVRFYITDVLSSAPRKWEKNIYDLKGAGKDHVIVALVDGEIKTEGMVGNYTVRHSNQIGDQITEIFMEYDETGKLLSTREE